MMIVISIIIILHLLLYFLSHHEYDNYLDVESVWIIRHMGTTIYREYIQPNDIKKILRKIKGINFYEDSEDSPLYESPTEIITISYKNGNKKQFLIAGGYVHICTGTLGSDSYKVKHYCIELIEKEIFMRTLPKEK